MIGLGKTIIFAKNNAHAEFIAERLTPIIRTQGEFARVVTYKTTTACADADRRLSANKMPHIAISVDILDTASTPEVVNLSFKVVRSRTKFCRWSTWHPVVQRPVRPRRAQEILHLFDYRQNLEFFSQNPEHVDGSASEPLSTCLFKTRLALIEELMPS